MCCEDQMKQTCPMLQESGAGKCDCVRKVMEQCPEKKTIKWQVKDKEALTRQPREKCLGEWPESARSRRMAGEEKEVEWLEPESWRRRKG